MADTAIPDGYHSVNTIINVPDAEGLIQFLEAAFEATEVGERDLLPDGRVGHAKVRIGDSIVMIAQATESAPARPCVLFVFTDDVDGVYNAALRAGAASIVAPMDQPSGIRESAFYDPWDNRWWVARPSASQPADPAWRRWTAPYSTASQGGRPWPTSWSSTA